LPRLDGVSIGVVATSPRRSPGCSTSDASTKAARFVRTCDAFNIPIVTFVDVPGFLPGPSRVGRDHPPRRQAAVRLREATVPKINVRSTHKHYGGANDVMSSKPLRADFQLR